MGLVFLLFCYPMSFDWSIELTFRVSTERCEFIAIMMLVELEFVVVFSGPFQSLLLLVFIFCLFVFIFSPLRESPLKFLAGLV